MLCLAEHCLESSREFKKQPPPNWVKWWNIDVENCQPYTNFLGPLDKCLQWESPMRCYTMHHNGKTFWASSVKLYLCFYSSYSFVSSLPFYISHSLYMSLHLSSDVYIFLFNWARNKEYVFWLLIISILLCYFWISKANW